MVVDLKRWFDLVFSSIAIGLLLLPASLVATLLIVTGQPVLVRRHRVGRNGRMLKLLEFPTAVADDGVMETVAGCEDEQPTRVGVYLRRYGIERWPWLLSVRYVGCYPSEVRKKVLSVKPGLIDLSSLEIREEQRLLQGLEGEALEEAYVEQVLPIRLAHAERYIETRSLRTDLTILLRTLFR
ncbi:MAG: sugar transferase [Oxalobacteraceae bacterium]|nr:sugar transferase [Oxalobacteraceae bacterium]